MPEYNNYLKEISWEIQQYLSSKDGYVKQDNDMKKDNLYPSVVEKSDILSSPLHDRSQVQRLESFRETTTKKARAKESSKHFGVRFRPDLNKWVAEIRVAEWKTVDKKIWLGTFETEEGAARAVDAARKLLNCKKKRPPNFPCIELDTFSEQIPTHLNLNNLGNDAMFKDVTIFIKRKAQEYAASFYTPSNSNCVSVSSSKQVPVICETSFCSQPELPHANSHEEMPLDSQDSSSSHGNWADESALSLCEAEVAHDHWQFGDSIFSQRCNFDSVRDSFYENDISDLIYCNQDHEAVNFSHSLWEDKKLFLEEMEYAMLDNLVTSSEYLIPSDNQEYYAQDQTMNMDIVSGDEIFYDNFSLFSELSFQKPSSGSVDTNMDWMLPQLHNSFFTGLDCTQSTSFCLTGR